MNFANISFRFDTNDQEAREKGKQRYRLTKENLQFK